MKINKRYVICQFAMEELLVKNKVFYSAQKCYNKRREVLFIMKKMKMILVTLILLVGTVGNINVAYASTNHEKTVTGFSGEWENTVFYRAYSPLTMKNYITAKMVYGYDTDFINEDYCWTYGYDQCTQASITNGNGTHAKSSANVGRWSKLEVRHKSADEGVTYRIWLENGYSSKYMVYGTDEK